MIYLIAPQKGTKRPDNISAPVGLCYIQSYLLSKGMASKIIDLEVTSQVKLLKDFKKDKPSVVGISCFTDNRQYAFETARILKRANPGVKIILGAHHASSMYRQILDELPEVDVIAIGEGELTFYDLIKAMKSKTDLNKVDGIAFREGCEIVETKPRAPIMDLDKLPFPSYKDLDITMYKWNFNGANVTSYDIVTSRGCPNACTYCSSSSFWGHRWRFRSSKNVVDEIEQINKKYGISHFRIVDDNFTAGKSRAIEICKEIIARDLKINFWIQGRVGSLANEDEYAQWLRKAGCYLVAFGIESGSQKILDRINKRQTVKQIIDACRSCKKAGIKINAYFMVGNPGETWRTVLESRDVIKKIQPDEIGVSITQIYPGTEIYDSIKGSVCDDDYWMTEKRPPMNTSEYPVTKLRIWQLTLLMAKYLSDKNFASALRILVRTYLGSDKE
jgi:anaerobic magnesium-protoporphyrin IX monomethyl ester cyclase